MSTVPDTVIETVGVSRRFGHHRALDDVSLTVNRDSIVGLLGRNGAGKTTLMRLLTAQDRPNAGSIRDFGEDPWENDSVLARTCFIREDQQYPNNFRVHHVLEAGPHFHPAWDSRRAAELVDRFGLPRRRQAVKLSPVMRSSLGILVGLASRARSRSSTSPTWAWTPPRARTSTTSCSRSTPSSRARSSCPAT